MDDAARTLLTSRKPVLVPAHLAMALRAASIFAFTAPRPRRAYAGDAVMELSLGTGRRAARQPSPFVEEFRRTRRCANTKMRLRSCFMLTTVRLFLSTSS
jgi:hypothetical protein